eukprot:219060-Rhodomonas_salina.1
MKPAECWNATPALAIRCFSTRHGGAVIVRLKHGCVAVTVGVLGPVFAWGLTALSMAANLGWHWLRW